MVDVTDLGDSKVLQHTVLENRDGGVWFAIYHNPDGLDVECQFAEKPKGQAMSSFCDQVRRTLSEREKAEENKKKREAAARRDAEEREAPSPPEPRGRDDAAPSDRENFKEKLERRARENESVAESIRQQINTLSGQLEDLTNEKAAVEAALEVYNGRQIDTRPTSPKSGRKRDRSVQSKDAKAGATTDGKAGKD